MNFLQQGVTVTVIIGPFLDDTDGKTPETALTIAQADVRLYKNAVAPAQKDDTSSATHLENGYYAVVLSNVDVGAPGRLRLAVNKAGALPVWEDFTVIPALVFESLIYGNDVLQVNAVQISGDSVAADNCEAMFDGTGYAGGTTKLGVNVVSQANIDFGALQKASITAAVPSAATIRTGLATSTELAKVPKSDSTVTWNATALASIKTQAVAALDDANVELATVPDSTGSIRRMIQFLFQHRRNKLAQTKTVQTMYKEDGATPLGEATLGDDGTTYTRGEMNTAQ